MDALGHFPQEHRLTGIHRFVFQQLASDLRPKTKVLANGETAEVQGIAIEALPMYNITPGRTAHTKGRGNGYVLTIGGKRFYIAGDTEDIPEMRALKNIDVAFLCMISVILQPESAQSFRGWVLLR